MNHNNNKFIVKFAVNLSNKKNKQENEFDIT